MILLVTILTNFLTCGFNRAFFYIKTLLDQKCNNRLKFCKTLSFYMKNEDMITASTTAQCDVLYRPLSHPICGQFPEKFLKVTFPLSDGHEKVFDQFVCHNNQRKENW